MQRRLAAILSADVVGYSRLMGADEMGTLTSLKSHRRELVDPGIATHRGRIVKTTGDGMLVEFASVVDAVGCAVNVQRRMVRRNASVPEEKQIIFRIGINVGDIIIDGDDIFGDGVNIAARLQTLCEPGGVCISRAANDEIRDKLSLAFADLGEQAVKNIARAVGVFGLGAKDIVAIPETVDFASAEETETKSASPYEQEIHFCQTRDGVQLAYLSERMRLQVHRQRGDIRNLQQAEISTASAEALLERMLDRIDKLCAERNRLKKEQGPVKGRALGGRSR
jgi:class 3 adenylate cyclase